MSTEKRIEFTSAGKEIRLYPAESKNAPLVIYNCVENEGEALYKACRELDTGDFSLAEIGKIDWNRDMSPWECAPVFKGGEAFSGGADEYLSMLINEILPEIKTVLKEQCGEVFLVGYSLAGLFALYAGAKCDVFSGIASVSGSLWYPDFVDFIRKNGVSESVRRVYLSLGDREDKTKNPVLATVLGNTLETEKILRKNGREVFFWQNSGNHYQDAENRTVKSIKFLLQK